MTAEENILAGQKELNKLYLKYQGTKYKKCPETGVMDEDTLISLRQAIQIEAKPDSYHTHTVLRIATGDPYLTDAVEKAKDEHLLVLPEVEAYQIIDENQGVLAITWHVLQATDYDHIKDLPLQDRLAQVNLTRTGDRVDLYRVNRRLYPNGRTD